MLRPSFYHVQESQGSHHPARELEYKLALVLLIKGYGQMRKLLHKFLRLGLHQWSSPLGSTIFTCTVCGKSKDAQVEYVGPGTKYRD